MNRDLRVPVVVLAGGKAKPELVALTGVENRALVPVAGTTMLTRVVTALVSSSTVGEITVVGNLPISRDYRNVADHGGFVENLFAGIKDAADGDFVLISTVDVPFLTSEVVDDFVRNGRSLDADLAYPIVAVEKCYEQFPGVKRTAIGLKEGRFTGGNMMLVRPEFILSQRKRIAASYAARKAPLKLAGILGIGTVARLLLSIIGFHSALNIPLLERAAGKLLGGNTRAYISSYPEIATDIDRPSDLEAIQNRGQ